MGSYIANFSVYTMAMLGLICFAFFVYKKITDGSFHGKGSKDNLSIEESLTLSPRKTLHVVKVGTERFLIAADIERTTLISKLNATEGISQYQQQPQNLDRFKSTPVIEKESLQQKEQYISQQKEVKKVRKQKLVHLEPLSQTKAKNSDVSKLATMREMAKRINQL